MRSFFTYFVNKISLWYDWFVVVDKYLHPDICYCLALLVCEFACAYLYSDTFRKVTRNHTFFISYSFFTYLTLVFTFLIIDLCFIFRSVCKWNKMLFKLWTKGTTSNQKFNSKCWGSFSWDIVLCFNLPLSFISNIKNESLHYDHIYHNSCLSWLRDVSAISLFFYRINMMNSISNLR